MLIPFSKYLKSILTNLKIPGTVFFAYSLFRILKKDNFLLILFFQILKSILTNLKIPGTIFAHPPFSNIKKENLQILKNLTQFFCSSPFSNIEKSILTNLKTSLFMKIKFLKETIYIKTIIQTILIKPIIQIDKHKVKYITNACIPIIIIII